MMFVNAPALFQQVVGKLQGVSVDIAIYQKRRDMICDGLAAAHAQGLIHRDVKDIARIDKIQQLNALLQMVSNYNGQLVNYSGIGAPLDMSHTITRKYLGILEQLFLIHKLNPWYSNQLKRLTKTPKLHFLDTGLLAALQGNSIEKLKTDLGLEIRG